MLYFLDNVHKYCTIAAIGGSRITLTFRFFILFIYLLHNAAQKMV